ncbi:MAG: ImuA family protein [Devosia sp.]
MRGLVNADLDALRLKIAALEKRPAFADAAPAQRRHPAAANDTRPRVEELLAIPPGVLHEVFTDEQRNGTAALGFALGLARGLVGRGRQAILYLQLADQAQEMGVPYALGLGAFGIDPDKLILAQAGSLTELLWAIEEAVACRAVAGVVADIIGHPKALDFTASRRLSLRSTAGGSSVFLIRYGTEREASAAKLRWRVIPEPSGGQPFDPQAPGLPRYLVEIEKRQLAGRLKRIENLRLTLDWTENGFVSAQDANSDPVVGPAAPASRPLAAALGHRLSQAG